MLDKAALTKDAWLSSILGRAVFRLEDSESLAQHLTVLNAAGSCFAYAKLKAQNTSSCAALEAAGFRLVDTNLLFSKTSAPDKPLTKGFTVRSCSRNEPAELQTKVYELASKSFSDTRFHLDPSFDPVIANTIKGEWVANFFRGERGEQLWIAEEAGRVLGFLLVIASHGKKVIDLIASDPRARGRGVGRALVACLEADAGKGTTIDVGTQLANQSSIGFYQKLGFQLVEGKYVFHYHS